MTEGDFKQFCEGIILDMYGEAGENESDVYTLTVTGWKKDGFFFDYEVTYKRDGEVTDVVYTNKRNKKEEPIYAIAIKYRLNELLDGLYRKGHYMPSLERAEGTLDEGFRDYNDLIDYLYG